jgi:hypothetical protein
MVNGEFLKQIILFFLSGQRSFVVLHWRRTLVHFFFAELLPKRGGAIGIMKALQVSRQPILTFEF